MKQVCPYCGESVHADAIKCKYCQSWLKNFKVCPQCAESVPMAARLCRFCHYKFKQTEEFTEAEESHELLAELPLTVTATPLGAMIGEASLTALFFPPELTIHENEIHIKKWTLLGLRSFDHRISTTKIASVRFIKGVVWGQLVIETFGGNVPDLVIRGLDKTEARHVAEFVEKLIIQPSSIHGD